MTHLVYGPVNTVARALVHQILEQPRFPQIRVRHQVLQHDWSDLAEPALFAKLPSGLAVRVVGVHFAQIRERVINETGKNHRTTWVQLNTKIARLFETVANSNREQSYSQNN